MVIKHFRGSKHNSREEMERSNRNYCDAIGTFISQAVHKHLQGNDTCFFFLFFNLHLSQSKPPDKFCQRDQCELASELAYQKLNGQFKLQRSTNQPCEWWLHRLASRPNFFCEQKTVILWYERCLKPTNPEFVSNQNQKLEQESIQ